MKGILSVLLVWLLSLFLCGCSNELNEDGEIDFSTAKGRRQHCISVMNGEFGKNYEVQRDPESEDAGMFVLAGLLNLSDVYYDVECVHFRNSTGIELNMYPIEELKYDNFYN